MLLIAIFYRSVWGWIWIWGFVCHPQMSTLKFKFLDNYFYGWYSLRKKKCGRGNEKEFFNNYFCGRCSLEKKKNERKCEENEEEGKKFRQNKIGKSKILTINVYYKIMFIITLFTWIKKHLSHGVNKSEMIWMSDEHFLILKNIFFQSIFLIIIIHWNM